MATIPNNRVEDIAREVSQAFNAVVTKDGERKEAREQFTEAAQSATSERETLLAKIAGTAQAQSWDMTETEMAIDRAKAQRNAKDTSINTFASEIKRACHPSVRGHVAAFFELADAAWKAEGDTEGDKPLRKAFARKYHMVVGAMFNAAIAGAVVSSPQDLVMAANDVIRGRERDYTAVHKRLKAIRAQLAEFAKDFPVEGITACVEFLDTVDAKELKACVTTHAQASPTPAAAVAAPEPVPEDSDDMLNDVLGDMAAMELKAA